MQQWSRRNALALIAGASVASYEKPALAAQPAQSLGAIAARNGIVFGAAAGPVIDKDRAYRELYQTQTRIVTTDIAMKMGTIAPQPGPKRFESADRLLQFCASNNIPMRGHCLIWNEWVPQWIRNLSGAEREKFFDSYIEEVAAPVCRQAALMGRRQRTVLAGAQGARRLSARPLVRHVRNRIRAPRL